MAAKALTRPLLVMLTVVATAFALSAPATAGQEPVQLEGPTPVEKGEYDSYIVIMQADPLVVTEGRENLDTPRAKARGRQMRAAHVDAMRAADVDPGDKVIDYVNALNGFSALITHEEANRLASQKDVAYVVPDVLRQPMTDSSPDFLGLTGGSGAWQQGATGKGVVVGVIDSGIWPEHPSFADQPGLAPPPATALPCEFGNTAHNPHDAPFACNDKLIGARQVLTTYRALTGAEDWEFDSARDDDGHGTHTASTAAGNGGVEATMFDSSYGAISGIAPNAHIIAYKGLGALGGYTSDLAAAIDYAVADGVDVINYSIGGGASVTMGADEIAFLFAADAGVHVATSAGNSGPGAATVGSPAQVPWVTTVGANTQSRFFSGTVVLGNGASYKGASITRELDAATPLVDAADAGGDLCVPGSLDPAKVDGAVVLCRRGAIARVDKSLAVLQAGGVGMVMYENSDIDNLYTDPHHVPSVHVDRTPGLAIKSYIASAGDQATARIVDTGVVTTWPSAPSMTIFSSRGPNIFGDVIKPDVTAPGMQILAGNTPMPGPGQVQGELFQAIAGTSMSSPHVAGVFALIDELHPDWSPAAAKSALMTTAHQDVVDNDRVTPADPFDMGAGHIDVGNPKKPGSAFQPGLVYDAGLLDYLGFLCDASPSVFANPQATCGALESGGVPTDASDLNLASIAVTDLPGRQTVTRTVTNVAQGTDVKTFRAKVDAPDGYEVSVEPATLRLLPGESASFEVTLTNQSAPSGQWRFGSLTWDGPGKLDARSPIAVEAALFGSPAAITGSGEAGSAAFDVTFGYSGDYQATGHGLVPATTTVDTVVQDPDQNFDPSDGFSNEHTFAVSGAAHLRFAMPPEATEPDADLDLFLYGPDGRLAASSTSGGTNELIDVATPDDGTWRLFVHGWAAPGGDSDYTLYSWAVSATPGGNLSIDSAPSEAVIGTTETIDVSWTGATDGQWHLGAVAHRGDGGGLMGLTFVEVDNR